MKMLRRFRAIHFRSLTLGSVLLVAAAPSALAQSAPNPSSAAQSAPNVPATASAPKAIAAPPLAAKLITILDSSEAKVGKKFHAYVIGDWTDGRCALHTGAEIEGHVSQVDRRTKTAKNGDLRLVFDWAECEKHHHTPLHMILVALLGPDDATPGGESGVGKAPEMTSQPLSIAGGLRSVETAAYNNYYALAGRSVPTRWTVGMVVGLPGTSLKIGGAAVGTVVTATNNDARLLPNTVMIVSAAP